MTDEKHTQKEKSAYFVAASETPFPPPPPILLPGTRVRIGSKATAVTLRAAEGIVARQDQWDDYVIVRLDEPATYENADGSTASLAEIRVMIDNLVVLDRYD